MLKPLCIWHGYCDDGFGAAWALKQATNDAFDYFPGEYSKPPPDVTGRHVVMVDFSYKRPVLEKMAGSARSILILDHHKTAQADLEGFGHKAKERVTYIPWTALLAVADNEGRAGPASKVGLIGTVFDMNRSGAGISWDFFNPTSRGRSSSTILRTGIFGDRSSPAATNSRSRCAHTRRSSNLDPSLPATWTS